MSYATVHFRVPSCHHYLASPVPGGLLGCGHGRSFGTCCIIPLDTIGWQIITRRLPITPYFPTTATWSNWTWWVLVSNDRQVRATWGKHHQPVAASRQSLHAEAKFSQASLGRVLTFKVGSMGGWGSRWWSSRAFHQEQIDNQRRKDLGYPVKRCFFVVLGVRQVNSSYCFVALVSCAKWVYQLSNTSGTVIDLMHPSYGVYEDLKIYWFSWHDVLSAMNDDYEGFG